jgi:hypothetical protein
MKYIIKFIDRCGICENYNREYGLCDSLSESKNYRVDADTIDMRCPLSEVSVNYD